MLCPKCGDWCQTSVHIGLPLWAPGQFKSLANHQGSKKCAATASKKQKHDTRGFSATTKPHNQSDQHSNTHDQNFAFPLTGLRTSTHSLCPFLGHNTTTALTVYHLLSTSQFPNSLMLNQNPVQVSSFEKTTCVKSVAHMNYHYLGLAHMRDMIKKHADQINQLKLQYVHALTQLDDFNWLLMAISHNDIPHIHQIIDVAL
ncbi:hypothetical protein BDR04DRAFT_1117037 [Suillus decipiens]|nr:hypothetical protein BDR04DRAFT_1117037 [Suillus decipiens]